MPCWGRSKPITRKERQAAGRAVSDGLAQAYLRSTGRDWTSVVHDFRQVEKQLLLTCPRPSWKKDIRRGTAGWLLMVACNQCPMEICRACFRSLARKGWSNLEIEIDYTRIYARRCAD